MTSTLRAEAQRICPPQPSANEIEAVVILSSFLSVRYHNDVKVHLFLEGVTCMWQDTADVY